METTFFCPFFNKKVDAGDCYDFQLIREGYIKQDILDTALPFEMAKETCAFCEFNQMSDTAQ